MNGQEAVGLEAERASTGVPGLDDMLRGGIPRGSTVLLYGGPGSGKTIISIQFLTWGAMNGECSLYVSAEEPKHKIYSRHEAMGFPLSRLEREGLLLFLDATPIRLISDEVEARSSVPKLSISSLLARLRDITSKHGLKRIVIDPLSTIAMRFERPYERRNMLYELFKGISSLGATTLISAEMRESRVRRRIEVEEYLSDGVISLRNIWAREALIRVVQVEKMRGTDIDIQPRPYTITHRGVVIHSDEPVLL